MTTTDLTQQLATRAAAPPAKRGTTVADLIEQQKPQIALALPHHLDTERFARIALTELRRNPRLAACNPVSLLGALMQSAQLGLEPGPLGQAYLVPFGNEVTFIIGYRGLIDLFRRSGEMLSIVAREVRDADEFEFWVDETGDRLRHVPNLRGDRGQAYAYYAIARFRDGGQLVHVMTRDDIDRHRKRSRSKDSGPWQTDYDAMARKTVIRAMAPYLPLSAEVASAFDADERSHEWRPATGVVASGTVNTEMAPVAAAAALPAPAVYDTWSKHDLVEECNRRSLASSGTKADLAARLIAHDQHQPELVEDAGADPATSTGATQEPTDVPALEDAPAGEPEPSITADGAAQPGPEPHQLPADWPASPAPSTPTDVADDPAFWSADRWAAEADARNLTRARVLREARTVADALGLEPPTEFAGWTDPAISAQVADWLTGVGQNGA